MAAKMRHCWNCGAQLGVIEEKHYDSRDTCGAAECEREAGQQAAEEYAEAHARGGIFAMKPSLQETADYMMKLADQIDGWADQSLTGGWSTHQVDANREVATKLRATAAALYRQGAA